MRILHPLSFLCLSLLFLLPCSAEERGSPVKTEKPESHSPAVTEKRVEEAPEAGSSSVLPEALSNIDMKTPATDKPDKPMKDTVKKTWRERFLFGDMHLLTEEGKEDTIRFVAEQEKKFEAWLKESGYDANRPRERLQPWTVRPVSGTLANGTRTTLNGHETTYSSCFKGQSEKFIVFPHPDKKEKFWIGKHESHFIAGRMTLAPLYFWEIGEEMYEVLISRGYVRGRIWKSVKVSAHPQSEKEHLDMVMREYFCRHSIRPTCFVYPDDDDILFGRSFLEGKETSPGIWELSKEQWRLRDLIQGQPHSFFEQNVTSVVLDGELWKVNFEQDLCSMDYSGVEGSIWLNLKERNAVKGEAWIGKRELAKKLKEEKLNRMKIEWEAGKEVREARKAAREAKAKAGLDAKPSAEKKAETVDKPKAAE